MEMGEQGIPDRFVDIFQGRAPRSVLVKHYTAKGIERLKGIYAKANLNILKDVSQAQLADEEIVVSND